MTTDRIIREKVSDLPDGFFSDIPPTGNVGDLPPNFFTPAREIRESVFIPETNETISLPTGGLARLGTISKEAFKKGDINKELGFLYFRQLRGDTTDRLSNDITRLEQRGGVEIPTKGLVENMLRATSEQVPQLLEILEKGGLGAAAGATLGAAAGIAITKTPAGAGVGARLGLKLGGGAGIADVSFQLNAGQSFNELRNIEGEDGAKIPEDVARVGAFISGGIGAALEFIPVGFLIKMIPGTKPLFKKLGAKVTDNIKLPFNKKASPATNKKALNRFLINLAKVTAAETGVELAQESIQIATNEIAKSLSDGEFEKIKGREIYDRLAATAKEALLATPGIAVPFAAPQLIIDVKQVKEATKAAKGQKIEGDFTAEVQEVVEEANQEIETLEVAEATQAQKEKVTTRLNVKLDEIVEEATKVDKEVTQLELAQKAAAEKIVTAGEVRQKRTDLEIIRGRRTKLQEDIEVIKREITSVSKEINVTKKEEKPTIALEKKIDKLIEKRDALSAELENISDAELVKAAQLIDPIIKEKAIIKGERLRKLGVQSTKDAVKALDTGFKKATVAIKKDVKNIQKSFDAAQKEIKAAINELKLKPQEKKEFNDIVDKAFIGKTKTVQSPAQLKKRLAGIQTKLINKLETKRKKQILTSIKSAVKGVKPKIQSRRKIGKLDEQISNEVEKLTDVLSLTVANARTRLDAILAFDQTGAPIDSAETILLALVADPDVVDVNQVEQLLLDIDSFIENGVINRKIKRIKKKIELTSLGNDAAQSIISDETIVAIDETGMQALFKSFGQELSGFADFAHSSWSGILEKAFDVKGANNDQLIETLSVTRNFQERKKIARQWSEDYQQRAIDAFGFTTEKQLFDRLFEDTKKIEIGFFDNAEGSRVRVQLSKAQIRQLWMIRQDKTLDKRTVSFGGKFNKVMTLEMETAAFEFMSAGDIKAAQTKMDFYSDIRAPINTVFQNVNGASFANIENYSPIRSKFTEKDPRTDGFLQEQQLRAGITRGSLKERTANQFSIKLEGDDGIIQRHVYEMSHYMAFAEKINDINIVFNNAKLRKSIEEQYGTKFSKVIVDFVTDFTNGSVVEATLLGRVINKFNSNFAQSVLSLKPSITIKQLTSIPALAETIPLKEFTKGSALFWKNPIKNTKELLELSELLRERGGSPEKDIAEIANTSSIVRFKKKQSYKRFLALNIEIGDKGAIVAGGWPVFNYHKNVLGKSTTQAIAEFEKVVAETQQSSDLDQLSGLQRSGAFGRTFVQFLSTPLAYLRREVRVIKRLQRGKATLGEFGKVMFIYHLLLPSLFQFVADFFKWETEHQLRAMLLGNFNSMFLIGDFTQNLIAGLIGDREFDLNSNNFLGGLDEIRRGIGNAIDGIFEEDADEVLEGLADMLKGGGKALGQPVEQGFNFVEGVEKFIDGNVVAGSALSLGWPSGKVKEIEKRTKKRKKPDGKGFEL